MSEAFYWVGVGVSALVAVLLMAAGALWFYVNFIHGRFGVILFQKGARRLSIASWHGSRLCRKNDEDKDWREDWPADDWPLNERPFYLSFRFGTKRLFLLAGILSDVRQNSITGTHPTPSISRGENHE